MDPSHGTALIASLRNTGESDAGPTTAGFSSQSVHAVQWRWLHSALPRILVIGGSNLNTVQRAVMISPNCILHWQNGSTSSWTNGVHLSRTGPVTDGRSVRDPDVEVQQARLML